MFVVATAYEGVRAGCLVGLLTQASIEPARMLVCLSKANSTFRVVAKARRWRSVVTHALPGARGLLGL